MEVGTYSAVRAKLRLDKNTLFLSKVTERITYGQVGDLEIRLRAPFEVAQGKLKDSIRFSPFTIVDGLTGFRVSSNRTGPLEIVCQAGLTPTGSKQSNNSEL